MTDITPQADSLLLASWFAQRLAAEALGSAFLLAAIAGPAVLGDRLSDDAGVGLPANAMASASVLYVLIDSY